MSRPDGRARRRPTVAAPGLALGLVVALCLEAGLCLGVLGSGQAGAATDSGTLSGQGGTFFQPVMTKLIKDAKPNFGADVGQFIDNGLDPGIAAFVGSGPGSYGADFAVTERPLTSTEASTASTDGRPFAYVPFAATPVAIATLVANTSYSGSVPVPLSDLCPHIQLTVPDVGALFGTDTAQPLTSWNDSRIVCTDSSQTIGGGQGVQLTANGDPTMANYALMALMDSDPTAKSFWQAGLTAKAALSPPQTTSTDTAPSEHWPLTNSDLTTPGGDQPFLGKVLNLNATTGVPALVPTVLGYTFPIASVWTGTPLGAVWNLPTAAVQNAANQFVFPTPASAAAAEKDATLASTGDPTTNNLVTFNPSPSDGSAYNNFLMEEEYLVVPLSGLPADKASALAGLVRFVLGPKGQQDITNFGAAPATTAMATAGLQVAAELDVQAAAGGSQPGSTTTTTAAGAANAAAGGTGSTGGAPADSSSGSSAGGSGSGAPGLAFTGAPDLAILAGAGVILVLAGTAGRRRFRRWVTRS